MTSFMVLYQPKYNIINNSNGPANNIARITSPNFFNFVYLGSP